MWLILVVLRKTRRQTESRGSPPVGLIGRVYEAEVATGYESWLIWDAWPEGCPWNADGASVFPRLRLKHRLRPRRLRRGIRWGSTEQTPLSRSSCVRLSVTSS